MAKRNLKEKALKLRRSGFSYSQIKAELNLSKSTLSNWLSQYPLTKGRIKALRDKNPRRIESFINTMRLKRESKLTNSLLKVSSEIGLISKRDLYIGGFFLYWAEGGKTNPNTLALTNTNPVMLRFFVGWLEMLGISKNRMKDRLQLYSDMNIRERIRYWSTQLALPASQFRRPSLKKSLQTSLSYKSGFGQGTCTVLVDNTDMTRYILMGLKYFESVYKI